MTASSFNAWIYAVIAWMGVIFFSSTSLASRWAESLFGYVSQTLFGQLESRSSSYDLVHLLADKGFHVSLFCMLAILIWQALLHDQNKISTILLIGAVTGACSEILQGFFPDRDPAVRDVLINLGGTALGAAICVAASRMHRRAAKLQVRV